ncbi:MAG TPA: hypothetical protein ENI92_07245 [Bacteroidetes bacterium]|nr:hypothetical protein [Bacteroidota bacterium]
MIARRPKGEVEVRLSGSVIRLAKDQASAVFIWPQPDGAGWPAGGEALPNLRTLADLSPGRRFRVERLAIGGEIRQRLIEMGFVHGEEGRIIREALLHDPIEVELKGYNLSLRRAEATGIVVEELDG